MKVTSANRSGSLKVLTLREDVEPGTPEFSSTGSWQGLAVKPDRKIQKLAAVRWADIDDVSSCPSSATTDGTRPTFPATNSELEGLVAAPSPALEPAATLTHSPSAKAASDGTEGDADGGEAPFEPEGLPKPQVPKANFELEGWLPFIPYGPQATDTELPTALELGAEGWKLSSVRKLFFGHLPSALPTGVLQWLLDTLIDRPPEDSARPIVFEPQLHFKDGWFKGCAHALVRTSKVEEVIQALHHRVLFDLHGIWYARNASEVQILQQYCNMLRNLPQRLRHEKLQGLPCNPLACEITRNF